MKTIVVAFMLMFIIEVISLMIVNPGRIFQDDIAEEVIDYYMNHYKRASE